MQKTILITGSTDGIGLETAKKMLSLGHTVLLHGRNPQKLADVEAELSKVGGGSIDSYSADLSNLNEVQALAEAVRAKHTTLDVLINNAGVLKTGNTQTEDGHDVRFMVNTFAPYLLTKLLLPILGSKGRVVNLSSAAQSPVDLDALAGKAQLDHMGAYAQSKLAITMWSRVMGLSHKETGPMIVAVNPGSLLASKMVKEGFGTAGNDLSIGVDILTSAAFGDDFAEASGQYFDNDSGAFADPHPDALDTQKCDAVMRVIESVLDGKG